MTRIAQYYDQYWTQGVMGWQATGERLSRFERAFLEPYLGPSSKALEFGCGNGAHFGAYIASRGCDYMGIDVSEAAVLACHELSLSAQVCAPDQPLPFPDERFNLTLCFEVLEHLFSPLETLAELRRVLSQGGYLLGSVPNAVSIGNRLLMALGHFSPGGSPTTSLKRPWIDPHIRFFSKQTLGFLLNEAGFRNVRIIGPPFCLTQLPVLHRTSGGGRAAWERLSSPLGFLATGWPSLFAYRLYFAAQKSDRDL